MPQLSLQLQQKEETKANVWGSSHATISCANLIPPMLKSGKLPPSNSAGIKATVGAGSSGTQRFFLQELVFVEA